MSTKKIYDAAVRVGEYEEAGETKGRYENVGAVLESDNGMFLLLRKTFNPAGVNTQNADDDRILISFFEPREKDGDGKAKPKDNAKSSNSRGSSRR